MFYTFISGKDTFIGGNETCKQHSVVCSMPIAVQVYVYVAFPRFCDCQHRHLPVFHATVVDTLSLIELKKF